MLLQDQLIHHFLSSVSCWTHVNTRERRHLASFDPYPCSYGVLATLTCQAMAKRLSFALEKSTGAVDLSNDSVKRLSFAFNWRGWLFQCPDLFYLTVYVFHWIFRTDEGIPSPRHGGYAELGTWNVRAIVVEKSKQGGKSVWSIDEAPSLRW